jgi:hypothetical protein
MGILKDSDPSNSPETYRLIEIHSFDSRTGYCRREGKDAQDDTNDPRNYY